MPLLSFISLIDGYSYFPTNLYFSCKEAVNNYFYELCAGF